MTDTGSKQLARSRAPLTKRGRSDGRHRILSRDALAYGQDTDDIEIEAFSDDVYLAARERAARRYD